MLIFLIRLGSYGNSHIHLEKMAVVRYVWVGSNYLEVAYDQHLKNKSIYCLEVFACSLAFMETTNWSCQACLVMNTFFTRRVLLKFNRYFTVMIDLTHLTVISNRVNWNSEIFSCCWAFQSALWKISYDFLIIFILFRELLGEWKNSKVLEIRKMFANIARDNVQ